MKKLLFLSLLAIACRPAAAQRPLGSPGVGVFAADYNKEESLYRAKGYVLNTLLGASEEPVKFEAFALAAATSGELTTLAYKCDEKKKEGLLLTFYGWQVNEHGGHTQEYAFKDFPKAKAVEMLGKLTALLDKETIYLRMDVDANNMYYRYDDVTFLLYMVGVGEPHVRVFWGPFDAEWNLSAIRKTERRLAKKI